MGKLIICRGKMADKPYNINLTDTNIYSIEEMCYYIYNNTDIISDEMFDETFVNWVREELCLFDCADKLQEIMTNKTGLKDLLVCILSSTDYYTETELKQLLVRIDEVTKLTPIERMQRNAANYIKYKQFRHAVTEYENILSSMELSKLTATQYGNLLHNYAYALLHTTSFLAASKKFKEAYDKNENMESLKQYLYTILIMNKSQLYQEEIKKYEVSKEVDEELRTTLQQRVEESENSSELQELNSLKELKQTGKLSLFYQKANDIIGNWKLDFRQEIS